MSARVERRHKAASGSDQRTAFQTDRDRIQYSSAFHRLAGVTQSVRAGEAGIFHTRQQHTYKVAQVGRRLAEHCRQSNSVLANKLGLDVEVVEAASLAHDLGHPPFGHAGEDELNRLVESKGDDDGFEGNAQSFRIVTKLAVRYPDCSGLNLTRATLNACLKYPWLRDRTFPDRVSKWGAYKIDHDDFEFAREGGTGCYQALESALMDWADDISYSVHDLEDFHRVGAIPWANILESKDALVQSAFKKWHGADPDKEDLLASAFDRISALLEVGFGPALKSTYDGARPQRVALRNLTSVLIGRFVQGTNLSDQSGSGLQVSDEIEAEVKLLKQITKDYITSSPALVAQQYGQRKLIRDIFELLYDSSASAPPAFLPIKLHYIWELSQGNVARFACDCIASLTEGEVVGLHNRLFGTAAGSVLDPIVR